jgi:hypothetical protein
MNYTDKQLLDKVATLKGIEKRNKIPLIIGVQSKADKFDEFDDKFYLFDENNKFVLVTTGTTNAGETGLKDFLKWSPKGTGIWKTNEFYNKCFNYGFTKGQECLRLCTEIFHFRDNNKNNKVEEIGQVYKSNTLAHFHGIEFNKSIQISNKIAKKIGAYSVMCQVANVTQDYKKIINFVKPFKFCDYAILKEF